MKTSLEKLAVRIESEIDAVIEATFDDGMNEYRDTINVRGDGFYFTVIDQGAEGMSYHFVDSSNLDDALSSVKEAIDGNWFTIKTDITGMI